MFNLLSTPRVTTPCLVAFQWDMADMHPSMQRFYRAAAIRDPACTRQVDIANAINESSQRVNNWEARGISKEGALAAQQLLGVNATYLLYGMEPALLSQSQTARLTGEMIRAAYRDAKNMATQGGAEAGDFDPDTHPDDAAILAIAISKMLREIPVSQNLGTVEVRRGTA
jgi:hypothetical protein